MTPYFTHNGISLRPVEVEDFKLIRGLRNNEETWPHLTDPRAIMPADQRRWYDSLSRDSRFYFVAFGKRKPFIGLVRMDEYDSLNRSIRVGLDVVPGLRRRGNGSKIYSVIKKYCFEELGLHRVWLQVLADNIPAIKLYARHKFILEGRLREAVFRHGEFVDYMIMSILESEYRGG